jgi:hypothetical protein
MFIATLILLSSFEYGRAWFYLRSVKDYRDSAQMQMLKESVDKLNRAVEKTTPSYFCNITEENLLTEADSLRENFKIDENTPEKLVARIRDQMTIVGHPPKYSTLTTFLGLPKKAQKESTQMENAIARLKELTVDDIRSVYCLEINDALSRVYFIKDIQTPEGVSALLPGQVEDFQARVGKARELYLTMRFPEPFSEQHTKFIEVLNEIAVSLRQNDNNYVEFARRLESEKLQVDALLESVRLKTTDLQLRPIQIALQAQLLYGAP